jgi:hypothetical protein
MQVDAYGEGISTGERRHMKPTATAAKLAWLAGVEAQRPEEDFGEWAYAKARVLRRFYRATESG